MLGKTLMSVGMTDKFWLFYKTKCHLCHLLPFAKAGQYSKDISTVRVCNKFKVHPSFDNFIKLFEIKLYEVTL